MLLSEKYVGKLEKLSRKKDSKMTDLHEIKIKAKVFPCML